MGTPTGLARVLEFAEAVAAALIPVLADFSGLGVASCLRNLKGFVKGPFVSCCCAGGVAADEDHLLKVTVAVPPSCRVVWPQYHPFAVECEVEAFERVQGVRPIDRMEEVGVEVEGVPEFSFDAVGAKVEERLGVYA